MEFLLTGQFFQVRTELRDKFYPIVEKTRRAGPLEVDAGNAPTRE
jgi:hypothetical protein